MPTISLYYYSQLFTNIYSPPVQNFYESSLWKVKFHDWFQTYKSNVLLLSPSITLQMAKILNYTPKETSKLTNYISYLANIQSPRRNVPRLRESVPYVKVYRYNPKHLYPKLNGYGNNGQRKVRSSCGSTYCVCSADALRVHCACP